MILVDAYPLFGAISRLALVIAKKTDLCKRSFGSDETVSPAATV